MASNDEDVLIDPHSFLKTISGNLKSLKKLIACAIW